MSFKESAHAPYRMVDGCAVDQCRRGAIGGKFNMFGRIFQSLEISQNIGKSSDQWLVVSGQWLVTSGEGERMRKREGSGREDRGVGRVEGWKDGRGEDGKTRGREGEAEGIV